MLDPVIRLHNVIIQCILIIPDQSDYLFFHPRHILAALHFNHNLVRDVKKKANGSNQVKLIYPKFKNGVASVRDVRIQPNYGVFCLSSFLCQKLFSLMILHLIT